jgi:hypothetical protein
LNTVYAACGKARVARARKRAWRGSDAGTSSRSCARCHAGIEAEQRRATQQGLAKRGTREYGASIEIEIVLLIAALAIAVFVALALPPWARRNGDASEAETRDTARSDDRGRQFKRWPNRRRLR